MISSNITVLFYFFSTFFLLYFSNQKTRQSGSENFVKACKRKASHHSSETNCDATKFFIEIFWLRCIDPTELAMSDFHLLAVSKFISTEKHYNDDEKQNMDVTSM